MDRAKSIWQTVKVRAGRGLAIAGALSLASSALSYTAQSQARKADKALPAEFVLDLDLSKLSVVEATSSSPFALLSGDANQVELRGVLRALAAAREDKRVRGLVTVLGDRDHLGGTAMVQEMRDAIALFRLNAKGRAPTVAYATSFGEAGDNGMAAYYLASASEQVYMQRTGLLGLMGFTTTELFLRPLLDRLQIQPHVLAREEYKSFANRFKESGFTAPHREQTTKLLKDISLQVLSHIALSRNLHAAAAGASGRQDTSVWSLLHPHSHGTDSAVSTAAGASESTNGAAVADGPEGLAKAAAAPPSAAEEASLCAPVLAHVDRAPLLAPAALQAGLINGFKYYDQVTALFTKSDELQAKEAAKRANPTTMSRLLSKKQKVVKKELEHVSVDKYLRILDAKAEIDQRRKTGGWTSDTVYGPIGRLFGGGTEVGSTGDAPKGQGKVAVVTAVGMIVAGLLPATQRGDQVIEASRMVATLDELREDPDVAAVVLRISSGGGSALASDTLHHALERLRASGKKLIVSMGDVAASGGYMMAAPADIILAQPATMTGSIGVIFAKFNVEPLLKENGVNAESIQVGANANVMSPFTGFSEPQLVAANELIDDIYDDFIDKVATGRNLTSAKVRSLAKGQVYTGRQALGLGLVDQLGGLDDAIATARKAANLPDDAHVYDYPARRIPAFLRWLTDSGMMSVSGDGALSRAAMRLAGGQGSASGSTAEALMVALGTAWGLAAGGGGVMAASAGSGGMGLGGNRGGSSAALAGVAASAALAGVSGTPMCYSAEAELMARCT